MRVYQSHHNALNDTITTADYYLVELNVYGEHLENTYTHTPTHIHIIAYCSIIVRIIAFWYQTLPMCVKGVKVNSAYFNVSNRVRQGGVLSPKLFAIYVDDLSYEQTLCKPGRYIDDQCINHVMYADDL